MALRLSNHPIIMLGIVALVASFAFLSVKYLVLGKGPDTASVAAVPAQEGAKETKARLGRERAVKDWGVAQKRADERNAVERARQVVVDEPATPADPGDRP
jgi:hypothetical protein